MLEPESFESWAEYRRFVERAQQELYRDLRSQYEAGELNLPGEEFDPLRSLVTYDETVTVSVAWYEPFRSKWEDSSERHLFWADDVHAVLWKELSLGTTIDQVDVGKEIMESDGIDYFRGDDERYWWYDLQAPSWALAAEVHLDVVTCFLAGLVAMDCEERADLYDTAVERDEPRNPASRVVTEWLFEPFERAAVVDGEMFDEAFDALEGRYEYLAGLTVWGTNARESLATPDSGLPDDAEHPRTWRVAPSATLAGLDWALTGPEDARATVTVDDRFEYETPDGTAVSGYHRATVDACDDAFPADEGDEVLVAAANVVGSPDRGPEGLTTPQRDRVETAETAPADLTDDDVDRLITWATTGRPGPRERATEALGRVAAATGVEDRHVGTLCEALEDPEPGVRQTAAAAFETVASAEPAALDGSLDALFDALEDGDDATAGTAAAALETVAAEAPSVVADRLDRLAAALYSDGEVDEPDVVAVRTELTRALCRLAEAGVDITPDFADWLVETVATDGRASRRKETDAERETRAVAARVIAVLDRDGAALDPLVDAVERRLVSADLGAGEKTVRLRRVAAASTSLVVEADCRDQLLEFVSDAGSTPAARACELLGALCVTHPEYVLQPDVVDAVLERYCQQGKLRASAAAVLGRLGAHRPELFAYKLNHLTRAATESTLHIRQTYALHALGTVARRDPSLLGDDCVERIRELQESHGRARVRSSAARVLAVVDGPAATEGTWDGSVCGCDVYVRAKRQFDLASAAVLARTDRSRFAEGGGFSWLVTVARTTDDPLVAARAMALCTEAWVEDPAFVDRRCLQADPSFWDDDTCGTVGETVEQYAATDDGDEGSARAGIDIVDELVAALATEPRSPQERFVDDLEALAGVRSSKERVALDEFGSVPRAVYGTPTPGLQSAQEALLDSFERAVAEHPERLAPRVESLAADLDTEAMAGPERCRAVALLLTCAGTTDERLGSLVVDTVAETLDHDDALASGTAGVVIAALQEHADAAAVDRAGAQVADVLDTPAVGSILDDVAAVAPGVVDTLAASLRSVDAALPEGLRRRLDG